MQGTKNLISLALVGLIALMCGRLASLLFASLAFLFGCLAPNASAQTDWEGDPYNPWPPYLSRAYPDIEPGNKLIKPIGQPVMRQLAKAVLTLSDGALQHVDELIVEAKLVRNTYVLKELVVFPRSQPYEDVLRKKAKGPGISSLSFTYRNAAHGGKRHLVIKNVEIENIH